MRSRQCEKRSTPNGSSSDGRGAVEDDVGEQLARLSELSVTPIRPCPVASEDALVARHPADESGRPSEG